MPSFADQIPTIRKIYRAPFNWCARIFRAVFTWRFLRRVLLGSAILATLITSFYLEELWRGQRAWDAARRAFEAQGGTLDLQKLAPPPVPDDQNFAMTPLLKPLFAQGSQDHPDKYGSELSARLEWPVAAGEGYDPDNRGPLVVFSPLPERTDLNDWRKFLGQQDILQALKKFDPVLNEISLASRRPFARFSSDYKKGPFGPPAFEIFIKLANIYEVRALAELAAGQTDRAAGDAVTIFQLANATTDEPFLFSQLGSMALADRGMQVFWEGLVAHHWSEAQLVEFSDELQKFDYLVGERRGVQGDIARRNELLERTMTDPTRLGGMIPGPPEDLFGGQRYDTISLLLLPLKDELRSWLRHLEGYWFPRGWIYQNRVVCLQDSQKVLAALDVPGHPLNPEKLQAIDDEIAQRTPTPYNFIANMADEWGWADQSLMTSASQTWMDEAQVACALERYRLANGQLPETLDQLTPKFIAKLPTDVISGGPLHYQRKADGHFLLYEVGWNGTDDGGVIAKDSSGNVDPEKGDWVWPDAAQP